MRVDLLEALGSHTLVEAVQLELELSRLDGQQKIVDPFDQGVHVNLGGGGVL